MSDQSLVHVEQSIEAQRFLPVMSLQVAVERRKMIVQAVKELMQVDEDYGVIPGTKKPTLLQPGADKLNNLFGLVPTFDVTQKEQDWTGAQHGGEPFFYFEVKCRLMRGDFVMGEGDGSANSWEARYRFRKAERVCPNCGMDTIIKGKAEYGGGWVCFAKKGGCGAKFKDGAPEIEEQIVGNVPNPNIFDLVNTVRKIANKRAKIAATLNATSAHEFFTQDLEDIPDLSDDPRGSAAAQADVVERRLTEAGMSPERAKAEADKHPGRSNPIVPKQDVPDDIKALWARMNGKYEALDVFGEMKERFFGIGGEDAGEAHYRRILRKHGVEKSDQFKTMGHARQCAREMYEEIKRLEFEFVTPKDMPAPEEQPA